MSFDSDFSDMSPISNIAPKKNQNIVSKTGSKVNNSAPVKSVKKTVGIKSNKSATSASAKGQGMEARMLEILPLCILQVVLIMVLKNVMDIRKRCKCNENKNLATILVVLYTLLMLMTAASITGILMGYPVKLIQKAVPATMIGIFIVTIIMTFAYIYKVEDKCDCPQTDNIYNLIKLYFGFLAFLFIAGILVFAFSYALD